MLHIEFKGQISYKGVVPKNLHFGISIPCYAAQALYSTATNMAAKPAFLPTILILLIPVSVAPRFSLPWFFSVLISIVIISHWFPSPYYYWSPSKRFPLDHLATNDSTSVDLTWPSSNWFSFLSAPVFYASSLVSSEWVHFINYFPSKFKYPCCFPFPLFSNCFSRMWPRPKTRAANYLF